MHCLTRRQLLLAAGAGAAALALNQLLPLQAFAAAEADEPGYKLPPLPYAFDALEPTIDAKTMEIHHDKHHKAYVDNLNAALKDHPDLAKKSVFQLVTEIDKVPENIRQTVINNGGGHANHSFFWEIMMAPKPGGKPDGALAKAIDGAFENFDKFQAALNDAAMKRFGSGWAWLVSDGQGKLSVISTGNQDSPLMKGQTPVIGIDVWEHAYYLKYQNKRADYVKAWWNVVNWKEAGERYAMAMKG
jgi:superoxide dismutase, Fe-Mn family